MINTFHLFSPETLRKDIDSFYKDKNYYKMAKRILSIALIDHNDALVQKLVDMFNSNIGMFSQVIANVQSMIWLLENEQYISMAKVENEIKTFIPRLSRVFNLEQSISEKEKYTEILKSLEKDNDKSAYVKVLKLLEKFLDNIVQNDTHEELKRMNLLRLAGGSLSESNDHFLLKRHAVKIPLHRLK